METERSLTSNWDDLVFENRNKLYGAFAIRKSYSRHILEAALASTLLVSVVLLAPQLISFIRSDKSTPPISRKADPFTLAPVPDLIPIVKPLKPPVSPARKSIQDLVPLVTTEAVPDVTTVPPTNGPSSGAETGGEPFPVEGSAVVPGAETAAVSTPPVIVDWAQVMPSYEGGQKAMMKYLQKNMKYPNRAKQRGIEGKVFIEFVVNYEGKIVNVQIAKGFSEDCDKEAARVVATMPNWKPGMQNKTPVSVRMILPIYFKLEN